MIKRFESYRKLLVLTADILLIFASFAMAFLIRFDGAIPAEHFRVFHTWLPVLVCVRLAFFYRCNLYLGSWRYASVNDLLNIAKAVVGSSIAFILVVVFAKGLVGFPRSVFVIDTLLTLFMVGTTRFCLRMYRELFPVRGTQPYRNLLIIGAGSTGNAILHEIKGNPLLPYNVVGFIDDDRNKRRMRLQGVHVLGTRDDIARICGKHGVREIIIAIPSAGKQELRPIIEACERTGACLKIVPAIGDLINGRVTFSQIREVQIEDLLGREEVAIDTADISACLTGRRVLVTGAGGSIGGEICRQVLRFHPREIVLLGRGENSIYQVHRELAGLAGETRLVQVIADVKDRDKISAVFRRHRPEIVFHAGANKHVPLLESNADEAVLGNVLGTRNVIEAAEECGVLKTVCISSDKAADPVSVMGCAKRIAELVIRGRADAGSGTVTIGVRFGNVLGSRGSVIPLFREQIRAGGPVTVTHPEMTRYFMTIPEAARLVLQAGAMGRCGDIYLLDMGSPVRISELAAQMIRLSGLEPERDIPIVYTGMRPGERLVEVLTGKTETLSGTAHPKIFMLQGGEGRVTSADLDELERCARTTDREAIVDKMRQVVPGYLP